jgi:hypothetical protein
VAAIGGPVTNPQTGAIGGPVTGGGGGGDSYGGGGGGGGVPPSGPGEEPMGFSGCSGAIAHSTISLFNGSQAPIALGPIPDGVVTTDIAVSPDGTQIAVIAAGNAHQPNHSSVLMSFRADVDAASPDFCLPFRGDAVLGTPIQGQVVAAAWQGNNQLIVQTRQPAMVLALLPNAFGSLPASVQIAADDRGDPGHEMFHKNSNLGIACAMCHPEGGDDGRTWKFDFGGRRTVALRGGILGTEPFHWNGDLMTMMDLTNEIFVRRMGGDAPNCEQIGALQSWVDTIPTLPHAAPVDTAQVARGAALFRDPAVGCASCHAGPKLTNNATIDVGGALPLQVPRLVGLADRAPYLHDGCASTLRDRFGACSSEMHGHTSDLTSSQVDDLVAFLNTL